MKKVVVRKYLLITVTLLTLISIMTVYSTSKIWNKFAEREAKEEIKEKEKVIEKDKKLSFVMVGDSLIHEAVYADAYQDGNYDFKPMLEEMKPIISSYDLAFYNQESILGGKELGLSTYPRFNSPYEVGDAFLDAGFDLVSLANNHTLDRGEQAIRNSLAYWKNQNAITAGSYESEEDRNQIRMYEKNGITYALFSYTYWTNGLKIPDGKLYLLNRYDEETVKQDIEKVRDQVDVIMVSMHFGNEYEHNPSGEQRKIASYLASLGVDIIIGHHPHVVQPIEFIDNTLVIYSLGNFLSAQRGIERLTGLMVSLDIIKDKDTNEISLENIQAELTYTYSDNEKDGRGNFKVYPYTKLTEEILPNYETYYQKYMDIVVHNDSRIGKSDYSGNLK